MLCHTNPLADVPNGENAVGYLAERFSLLVPSPQAEHGPMMHWSRVVRDPGREGTVRWQKSTGKSFHCNVQKWSHSYKAQLRGVLCSLTETFVSRSQLLPLILKLWSEKSHLLLILNVDVVLSSEVSEQCRQMNKLSRRK